MESNAGRRDRRVVVPSPDSEPSASRSSPARDFGNVEDATTALAAEQAYAQYAKRQSGIYKKLMPYMHKYKKKILACWEDGAHTFRLQRMPFQIQDIQYTTTCGHPYCPSEHGIMEPGALRVSIERNEHPDSEIDWSQRIPLEPIPKNFNAAWVQWPDGVTSKGKGKEVKHWLCLTCLEDLWMEATGFDDTTDDELDLPKMGDLSVIQPENRTRGPNDKLYNLSSPYVYALAKWAAVIRYQDYIDPIHKSEAARCYEGEPGTLYKNLQTRDMHGIDELTGAHVEVSADQIRSSAIVQFGTRPIKFLSEVLEWVDVEVSKVRQELADSSGTPKTIPEYLAGASTHLHARTKDNHGQIAHQATILARGDETKAKDEPVPRLSVLITPHRKHDFTKPKKAPASRTITSDDPEDAIAVSSSALFSFDDKQTGAQFQSGRKPSGDTIMLSSSPLSNIGIDEVEPQPDMVSRAGPAVNRANDENVNVDTGDNERDINKSKSKSKTQNKVKKKKSQNTRRRKSNVPKADKPNQGSAGKS